MDWEPTAIHEGGHVVIARALGLTPVAAMITRTTTPGTLDGCAEWVPEPLVPADLAGSLDVEVPFAAWPWPVRQRIERDVIARLAGEVAEVTLRPRFGRVRDPVHVQAVELAADAGETDRWAAGVRENPPGSDADAVARAVFFAFGQGNLDAALAWLTWCRAATASLVLAHEDAIQRVALVLGEAEGGLLGGRALAAAIDGRPNPVPSS